MKMVQSYPYFLGTVTAALVLLLASAAPGWSEDVTRSMKTTAPVMEGRFFVRNVCTDAKIETPSRDLDVSMLERLVDGTTSEGVDVSELRDTPIKISPRGRPPWVNEISVFYQGEIDFQVSVNDLYRREAGVEFTSDQLDHGNGLTELKLTCADMRITSLVLVPTVAGNPTADPGTVLEVKAFFHSYDPDDGRESRAFEAGDEYVQYYSGKPCGGGDITGTRNDARSFSRKLRDALGWTWLFSYGNSSAWEKDFTHNFSTYDVDRADFVWFSGHGGGGKFCFSHRYNDCTAKWWECKKEWGDEDMEWIALSACKTMKGGNPTNWHKTFDRLHLILGWETVMYDVNLGAEVAKRLTWGWRVSSSWIWGARTTHGDGNGSTKHVTRIIGETRDNFEDHAWGAGYVSPDAYQNNTYWYIRDVFYGWKKPKMPQDRSDFQVIDVPGGMGPVFVVSQDLLNNSQRQTVPLLLNEPRIVDTNYVRALANAFCEYMEIFCPWSADDIWYNELEGIYSIFDGAYELHVHEGTGGWEIVQSDRYAAPTDSIPDLPSPQDAQLMADALLESIGWLQTDGVPDNPRHLRIGMVDTETGREDVDSSYDVNVTATYRREYSGYRIDGPGATLEVGFGHYGELQNAFCGGWRDLVAGPDVTTISLEEGLEDVACSGPDIALGSMPLCDTFVITDAQPAYIEAAVTEAETDPEIVWLADGYCLLWDDEEEIMDTSLFSLLIPSRERHPCGQIDSPTGDTTIIYGSTITFQGSATSGTPPYNFYWSSDIDGHLGSGSTLNVPNLSTVPGGSAVHTITLVVADSNYMSDQSAINVTVVSPDTLPCIEPDPMYAFYVYAIDTIPGIAYLRTPDLPSGYTVADIDLATLLINGTISPTGTQIVGDELQVFFDAREFVAYYGSFWGSNEEAFDVSGQFTDTTAFTVACTVTMIGHRPGDINADGEVNIADATFLVDYLFRSGPAPPVMAVADMDCSGLPPNIGDLVYLVEFIFMGGPDPEPCPLED